ncbi:MAG TPA: acyl-CoA thioesterase [Saprospiraceae bacterium]|nr:acyl-CoA thioesterase [Saprospiraceae bacterium]HQW55328.1 acyl-CoA thioesterase [Saprospiraceae bacterium]
MTGNIILLQVEQQLTIRFSEVDSMGIVWHGHYLQYLEEAREAFGRAYKLGYLDMYAHGFQVPLIDLNIKYKQSIVYGDVIKVVIKFKYAAAAKIQFDYEIYKAQGNILVATANTTQVFLSSTGELQLIKPDFYKDWERENGVA